MVLGGFLERVTIMVFKALPPHHKFGIKQVKMMPKVIQMYHTVHSFQNDKSPKASPPPSVTRGAMKSKRRPADDCWSEKTSAEAALLQRI